MPKHQHGGDVFTAQDEYGGPILDFSANLNPLGVPPAVLEAASRAVQLEAGRYPDPLCRALVRAIARADGAAESHVVCGGGAGDLIFRLVLALRPRRALVTAPTFSEYEQALGAAGCRVERHILRRENQFNVTGEILEAITPRLDLVFLCTPNNPTGRLIDPDLLERILARCEECGALLAVDECFLSLSDAPAEGMAPLVAEHPGLFLLRAFTKSYAVAGLRLGYALSARPGLLERMGAVGQPWSVSAPAQAAGLAALACPEWPARARSLLRAERPWLMRGLEELGFEVCPGQANYLLFRAPGQAGLRERLARRGVLIRSCANYHGLGEEDYRVCVRTRPENETLLRALREELEWQKRL